LNSQRTQIRLTASQSDPQRKLTTIESYRQRRRLEYRSRNRALLLYSISIGVVTLGLSYAAVPLYRVFCSVTGYNGTPQTKMDGGSGKFASDRIDGPVGAKTITVRFNADKSDTLDWKFWPCQKSIVVRPGETVLAFYKAKNLSKSDVLGVATYNVTPAQVAPYFAKVECFCFDEQRLLAGEEIDLPIFFFIDKDFVDDPLMKDIDDIVLSYTFFKAKRNSFGHIEPDIPKN
ncbi:cytochrome c oxidase subunit XI assembly protein, partial [Phakopsora pachyrhizi]